ncbi:MAG: protein kinase [Candidatus Sulfotelmatobacter sp.]
MTPEQWQKIRPILESALELDPAHRMAFLDGACTDPVLRHEVDSLIVAQERNSRFLEGPAVAEVVPDQDTVSVAAWTAGMKLGPYEIHSLLGAGGMGEVYRANDTRLDRNVAVKVLPAHLSSDPMRRQRFEREARAIAAVQHSNICTVYDVGEHEGRQFIVMELLEGQPLSHCLKKQALPEEKVVDLGIQIVDALGAAHDKGILHRDLKPANILVTNRGQAKILDFGLAKLTHPPVAAARGFEVTEPQVVMGTLPYMAPEQLRGETSDVRTDIWGVGTVLYQICTGQPPFPEEGPLLVDAILNRTPRPPREINPEVSSAVERVVVKALEKDPNKRYQTAYELGSDLQQLSSGRAPKSARRPLAWIAVALLLLGAGLSWFAVKRFGKPTGDISGAKVRRSVAVLGFKDLAGRSETAWLSAALSEMLTTEVEAGPHLRTISAESVTRVTNDLGLVNSDNLPRDTLARIRKNSGSDLVVLGSYLDLGKESGGQIRLDLRIQDAASGETITSFTENGNELGLLDLVGRTGAELRQRLGAGTLSEADKATLKASRPSTVDAARLYAEGLSKLRVFDALAARDLLQQATAADPNNPLIHSAEAHAWSLLGYEDRARQAAKQAFDLSVNLPPAQRLQIEARYWQATAQWEKAIAIYRDRFNAAPDNLEDGLNLANAQVQGGKGKDALQTLVTLRKLPSPQGEDPRIDFAEADAANSISDFKRQLVAAGIAVQKSDSQGARLLMAQARIAESRAFRNLGEPEKSNAASEAARALFASVGDRLGEARVLHNIGAVDYDRGDLNAARKAFDDSFAIRQQIGNRRGAANELNSIAVVLTHQKNIAEALNAYKQSLEISKDVGDMQQTGVTLNNLGTLQRDTGDFATARQSFGEALALDRKVGKQGEIASVLINVALMLTTEGDLTAARSDLEQVLQIYSTTGEIKGIPLIDLAEVQFALGHLAAAEKLDTESYQIFQSSGQRVFASWPLYGLAEIQLERDDLKGAREKHEEALRLRQQGGETKAVAESYAALSAVYREQGQLGGAENAAAKALSGFQEAEDYEGQSHAHLSNALTFLGQSRLPEAQRAILQARNLAKKSASYGLKIELAIADARLRMAMGQATEAKALLANSLQQARRKGLLELEYESRLGLGELEGRQDTRSTTLQKLQKEAVGTGYLLIARKASAAATKN